MKSEIPEKVRTLWKQGAKLHSTEADVSLFRKQIDGKLANLLSAGEHYFYLFDIVRGEFDWISEGIATVLGFQPVEVSSSFLADKIHPKDLPCFLAFEIAVMKFYSELPVDKRKKYKVRYDFRLRKRDGLYARILQQTMVFSQDENGEINNMLGTHTEISYLKSSCEMGLSFIGLDGEPSFINVNINYQGLSQGDRKFSKREREVIRCLADGLSSKQAGDKLFISAETVNTYRRNLLKKAEVKNIAGLIRYAIEKGLI